MSGELGVYASFLKDSLYAVSSVFLFWIAKWPLQWVFYLHALTWLAFAMYTSSNDLSFWAPTGAAVVSVAVGAFDAFTVVNLVCYLPGTTCCIGSAPYAPFTLGEPVCGASDRYDPATLVWLAIIAVGVGVLTNIGRIVGIYGTRQGTSIEIPIGALYIGLKVYLLCWWGVKYTSFFVILSVLTMAWQISANLIGFKMRFIAVLLLLGVLLIDLLAVLGATRAITTFEAATADGGNRRLLSWSPSQPAWTSSDGEPVPPPVRRLWLSIHFVFLVLSTLQVFGWLTRSYDRPNPFGVPKQVEKGDENESEMATNGTPAAARFAGYTGTTKRGSAKPEAGRYI